MDASVGTSGSPPISNPAPADPTCNGPRTRYTASLANGPVLHCVVFSDAQCVDLLTLSFVDTAGCPWLSLLPLDLHVFQSALATCINGPDSVHLRKHHLQFADLSFHLLLTPCNQKTSLSILKPLHISSIERLGAQKPVIKCEAYEADRSEPIESNEAKSEVAKKAKVVIYFATLWALNVLFNIYNKKLLNNGYPYPC